MISPAQAKVQVGFMPADARADTLMLAGAIFDEFAASDYFNPPEGGCGVAMARAGRQDALNTAGQLRYTAAIMRARG